MDFHKLDRLHLGQNEDNILEGGLVMLMGRVQTNLAVSGTRMRCKVQSGAVK